MTINEKTIPLANIVLIVGANGTGKTRLLDEAYSAFTGIKRNSNYWNLNFEYDSTKEDRTNWRENLHQLIEREKIQWYCPFSKEGQKINQQQYESLDNDDGYKKVFPNDDFLKKEFTHYLPVEERTTVPGHAPRIAQSQAAADPLNLLFRSSKMFKEIQNNLLSLFNKKLWLAPHNDPELELRLADESDGDLDKWLYKNPPKAFQKYQAWLKENNIGNITIEGHGVRAFLHIMLSYTLPTNSILMIDEPEIHLYPSIKRKFGQLLGTLAQKGKKQFICVTHDSDFLQGVFDAKCDLVILKLSKKEKEYSVINTEYKSTKTLWAKQNQTNFLQLAFLDCGIIVEGSTDRLVYEYVFSDQKFLDNIEYKFIAAGGKDSISNPEKIAQDLKTPYAIILDIDNLKEKEYKKAENFLKLSGQTELLNRIKILGPKLKGIPDLKKKGVIVINNPIIKKETEELLLDLEKIGIFIVPCGCLESWREIDCIKAEFPEKFIRTYKRNKRQFKEVINFLKKIDTYLNALIN